MISYLYYPGCAMESSARAYHDSLLAISDPLGLSLEEIRDWNCCGATEYMSLSATPAYALICRNLALAAKQADNGLDTVLAPCSACYLNLSKANHHLKEDAKLNAKVNEALAAGGLSYEPGTLAVRHLLDVIIHEIGLDVVKSKVTRPLTGLRVAPYLGCMVPRPDYEHRFSDHEYPTELDRLLRALGATVVDFPLKTHCCGGHMTQIGPETAYELIRRLLNAADHAEADVMTTVCPMCQMNLDAYQNETNRHFHTHYNMPILFFTQLMGLAFGMDPKRLGFGKEFVSAQTAMAKIGVETPAPEEETPQRKPGGSRRDKSLPMPRMSGEEEKP